MKLLTKDDVAKQFSLLEKDIHKMINEGMPSLKIGNSVRFVEKDVTIWMENYKPNQQALEDAFVDEKGRTLKEYVNINTLCETLQMSKQTIYKLCKQEMPFVKVGTKRFFHIEDIIIHFNAETTLEQTEEVVTKKEEPTVTLVSKTEDSLTVVEEKETNTKQIPLQAQETILVVDGSSSIKKNIVGAGLCIKHKNKLLRTSFCNKINNPTSQFAEYLAIFYAMEWVEKHKIQHATIVTDQLEIVQQIQKGEGILTPGILSKKEFVPYFSKIQNLYKKAARKKHIHFVYRTDLHDFKPNDHVLIHDMYNKAHDLSREYKNKSFKDQNINVQTYQDRAKKRTTISKDTPVLVMSKSNVISKYKNIQIQFNSSFPMVNKETHSFSVTIDGKKSTRAISANTAFRAALLLAKSFASSIQNASITIEKLPSFSYDIQYMLQHNSQKELNSTKRILQQLIQDGSIEIKDSYDIFLNHFEKKSKAI